MLKDQSFTPQVPYKTKKSTGICWLSTPVILEYMNYNLLISTVAQLRRLTMTVALSNILAQISWFHN